MGPSFQPRGAHEKCAGRCHSDKCTPLHISLVICVSPSNMAAAFCVSPVPSLDIQSSSDICPFHIGNFAGRLYDMDRKLTEYIKNHKYFIYLFIFIL